MIVVANTSPLTNLAAISQFDLLQQLYGQLHIADGVWQELNADGHRWPGCDEVEAAEWIKQYAVQNQTLVTALRLDLHLGEAETIALAIELDAKMVLLDEKEARHTAQQFGLKPVGVVGILLEAKAKGLVRTVQPHLVALRQVAGFWLDDLVYQRALGLTGERSDQR